MNSTITYNKQRTYFSFIFEFANGPLS